MRLAGAIEAGGTKFVCAVGTGPDDIREEIRFPTEDPMETLNRAMEFFIPWKGDLCGLGIGSFGPVDLLRKSPAYGFITSTPKPGWRNTDMAGTMQKSLGIPVAFDTDVNAAARGEHRWGAGQELDSFIYLTVGTGIGGGAFCGGAIIHGAMHPEMGHILMPHDSAEDPYKGKCPYHGSCLEGLASGPAIEERWGKRGEELPEEHPAWELEAQYLAAACAIYTAVLSPERIILGGGVMEKRHLFPLIRGKLVSLLNGYIEHRGIMEDIDSYITPPALGNKAGILGAMAMALDLQH